MDRDNRDGLLARYEAALRAVGRSEGYIAQQITTGRDVPLGLLRRGTILAERSADSYRGRN